MTAVPAGLFEMRTGDIDVRIAVVDLAHEPQGNTGVASDIRIGVDRGGRQPVVIEADYDLLLTTGAPPSRAWINVSQQQLDAELARLTATIGRHGLPALVLAQVLRVGRTLSVPDALLLESFAYSTLLSGQFFRHWLSSRKPFKAPGPGVRVRCERAADVWSVILANPARRNAFDARLRDELVEVLAAALDDPTSPEVRLRADGAVFSAGGDLAEFGTAGDLAAAHAIRTLRSPAALMHAMAARATVVVQGACVGAGIEIAAAAGCVIAERDALFWLPELAMGLIPGAGGTATIARRIGRQRLLHWALSGARIDADTALAWGLVDAIESGA
jgi:hypothetical protein